MVRRRKSNLPKWRYEFDCRKCDNIREVHDPRKGRDGDYCIPCIERMDSRRPSPIHADEKERVLRCEDTPRTRAACNVAQGALYLQMKASPYPDGDENVLACQNCKSGEYLYNEDGNRNSFCGQCGKAIDWGEEADK